jgi:hypothetical protein
LTSPNWVHLWHLQVWKVRAQQIVDVARTVSPEITDFQVRALRAHVRNEWVRLGGCWCVTVQRMPGGEGALEAWAA